MKKVGFIVMGSGENRAAYQDMIDALGPEIDVTLVGVLDGFRHERVEEIYSYEPGENYIVTEVPWRDEVVHISEQKARREVCRISKALYAQGIRSILVVCTGDFDRPEDTPGLFYLPEDVMLGFLTSLHTNRIGFIVPEGGQVEESQRQYQKLHPLVRSASPYGSVEDLARVAESFKDEPVDLIVTDCMGFTAEMGRLVAQKSGKQVLVPRLIIPKLIKAMLLQE